MLSIVRTRLGIPLVAALLVGVGFAATMPFVPAAAAATRQKSGCGRIAAPGTTTQHVTVDGVDRQYLLSIPDDYDRAHRAPLILDFHGLGSNMQEQSVYSQLTAKAGARGYIVITPDGLGDALQHWSIEPTAATNPDVRFVKALLGETQRALCIDSRRVYSTGMSNGAIFSTVLPCALPGRFAAIAPVAGVNGAPVCATGTPRVDVLAFHGTGDPIVPYLGGDYFSGVNPTHNSAMQARPVDDAVAQWASFDGCGTKAVQKWVAQDVEHLTYPRCAQNGDVELYRVLGGGHTWPGAVAVRVDRLGSTTNSIDATKLMLDFFDAHPRA